jgi:hypothetical protein
MHTTYLSMQLINDNHYIKIGSDRAVVLQYVCFWYVKAK